MTPAICYLPFNPSLSERQDWAQSRHPPLKEAALLTPWRLNVGNLRNTGRSTESAPPAAMAEIQPHASKIRQHLGQIDRSPMAANMSTIRSLAVVWQKSALILSNPNGRTNG